MKPLVLTLLLALPSAHAQMYKCVDPSGKTRYSDKPIPDCKSATTVTAPTPAPGASSGKAPPPSAKKMPPTPNFKGAAKQDKKGPAAPPPQAKAADPTEHDRKYANAQCRELKEEEAWLQGPRGAKVENRDARLGQVRQALRGCR